jgi:hypothetical protein
MVSNRKMPSGFSARGLADDRVEVGHMFEHVTAVGEVDLAVAYRQSLTGADPIVDIETGAGGVATCRLDRH